MSRIVGPAAVLATALTSLWGCAPEISPSWKIGGIHDLAAKIAVSERGPLGQPLVDDPIRPFHEALPFDTVRATPLIVDTDGPVATEDLELQWVACDRVECTEALLDYDTLPSCEGLLPILGDGSACAAGESSTAELVLGVPPKDKTSWEATDLVFPPAAIVGIGSIRGAPGAAECQRRLADRAPLGSCFILHQNVAVGPAADLIAFAREQGAEIDTTVAIPDSILLRPRNHTPAIERFSVEGLDGDAEPRVVEMGSTLRVPPGATFTIRYLPDELDIESFEVIAADGTPLSGSDFLQAQWFGTGDHESFDALPQLSEATVTLSGFEETSFLYVLVRDGFGSTNVGWLRLDARTAP